MTAFRSTAIAGVLLLGLGAVANAQTARSGYLTESYDRAPLMTGRSVYVAEQPRSRAEADQIVMGLRVPYGPRDR